MITKEKTHNMKYQEDNPHKRTSKNKKKEQCHKLNIISGPIGMSRVFSLMEDL